MPRGPRINLSDSYHHVVAHGNHRDKLFLDGADYRLYLRLLRHSCISYKIETLAYCLMPNHLHLLLHSKLANLSEMMKAIHYVYVQCFNRRHGCRGHLFQGRFKSRWIINESYLHEVGRYIHMNPVRAGIAQEPGDYPWSSYLGIVQSSLPKSSPLLKPFTEDAPGDFHKFTVARRDAEEDHNGWPRLACWYSAEAPARSTASAHPTQILETNQPDCDDILQEVARFFGCEGSDLTRHAPNANASPAACDARWAMLWILRNSTILTLFEIASRLGYKSIQVAVNTLARADAKLKCDPAFSAKITGILSKIDASKCNVPQV